MSYLSRLLKGQDTFKTFVSKSVTYLATKTGITVDAKAVDGAVAGVDGLTDNIQNSITVFLREHLPQLPAEIAISATNAALNVIDAAAAGVGQAIKDATPPVAPEVPAEDN